MKLISVYPEARKRRKTHRPTFYNFVNDFLNADFPETATSKNTFRSKPSVNVLENNDEFRIELAAPGLSKKDFDIQVENQTLTISANKEVAGKEDEKFVQKEFAYTSFSRTFNLPKTIDTTGIKASFKNGILTLALPKKEEAKALPPRKVEIG